MTIPEAVCLGLMIGHDTEGKLSTAMFWGSDRTATWPLHPTTPKQFLPTKYRVHLEALEASRAN